MIRTCCLVALVALTAAPPTCSAARLLLPLDAEPPVEGRPSITILEEDVEIVISDEHATTRITQVLRNHTGSTLEGTYVFPLPEGGAVSDFATWDDGIRIPGVILEREEARRIYNSIVRRRIDPGLVEQQDDHVFTVQVFPIPPYGTKRLEMEFTQLLDVDSGGVRYVFPLASEPSARIDTFRLQFEVHSSLPVAELQLPAETLEVTLDEHTEARIAGHVEQTTFLPTQDFILDYVVRTEGLGLRVLSHHEADREEPGYFLVSALPSTEIGAAAAGNGHDVVLLFDTSYSMMGEGLAGSVQAARELVASLGEDDRVAVITFADELHDLDGGFRAPGEATAADVEHFLLAAPLGAGTDLEGALLAGLDRAATGGNGGRSRAVVLVTDGHQTIGNLDLQAVEQRVMQRHDASGATTQVFAFSVGQGTEDPLLRHVAARTQGHFEHVRGYGDLEYRLERFLDKLDLPLLSDIHVRIPGRTEMTYPETLADTFLGSRVLLVGRYARGVRGNVKVAGKIRGQTLSAQAPVQWTDAPHGDEYIARLWARARVDHLLERIHVEGYREEWRDEIVELSRRYKFVTPYTSFLAAPRALLRPRVIKPGDPVLTIRAPEDTERVSVVFPFGETKPAAYDPERGLWACRFLVPVGMEDGDYEAIVILTDGDGRQVRERKSFVIDSQPPSLDVALGTGRALAGEAVQVRVDAPPDTGQIVASLLRPGGGELLRVPVRWDAGEKLSTGVLQLPEALPPGVYPVFVHATDFAANETGRRVELEVL